MNVHVKLALAAASWGMTPVIGRAVAHHAQPEIVTLLRFATSTAVLFALIAVLRTRSAPVRWRHLPVLAALGLTGVCLHNVLMFRALESTSANRAAVIMAAIPIMVGIIDVVLGRWRPHAAGIAGVTLAALGTALVVTDGRLVAFVAGGFGFGEMLLLGSALSWAAYTVICRGLLDELSALDVAAWSSLCGTLMLCPYLAVDPAAAAAIVSDPMAAAGVFFMGAMGSGFAYVWYAHGVFAIGAVAAATYINLIPIFTLVFALVLLGEGVTGALVVGGAMVLAGLVMVQRD